MKGKAIKSVERVCKLASMGKSVFFTPVQHSIPAAFVQNYSAHTLNMQIKNGLLYEYKKKAK